MSMDEQYGRIPPQAVEIEEGVLGLMLLERDALEEGIDRLAVNDFYKPAHRHVFSSVKRLVEKGVDPDLMSVEQELRDKQLLDVIGGGGYLMKLTGQASGLGSLDYHIQVLNEKSTLRQTILECTDIIKECYNGGADPYEILDRWEQSHEQIEDRSFLEIPKSVTEIGSVVLRDTLEERNVSEGMVGVPAYLPVDRLTAGFPSKRLTYIAARPSMGKTGYMLTIVKNLLEKGFNKPILIFSYEMDTEILLLRLLCMMAEVNMQFARRGKLNDQEKIKLANAASRIGIQAKWDPNKREMHIKSMEDSLLFIEDDNMTDVDRLEAKARRIKKEHGLGIVFVDYLQLVTVTGTRQKNIGTREQEVAYISRSLVKVAKKLDVPFVPLSQLSRAVETRSGSNRPQLSDLRESGAIEQDAEIILFLYRPEQYDIKRTDEGISTKGLCEVIVGKNRNGPTGTIKHEFIAEYATFRQWDEMDAALRDGSGPPEEQTWVLGKDDPGEYSDKSPF